jgi:hypothetical protein
MFEIKISERAIGTETLRKVPNRVIDMSGYYDIFNAEEQR